MEPARLAQSVILFFILLNECNADNMSSFQKFKTFFKVYWRSLIIIIWPSILATLIILYDTKEMRCASVVLLMAMFWMTEALPLGVTALLPVVLFPTLGILGVTETSTCYMNETILVFLGGMILAIAIEHCQLHLRIAIGVMKCVGCSHKKLLAGLLAVILLLGMWISNTACTAMMVPIIFAVLNELEKEGLTKMFVVEEGSEDPEHKIPSKITRGYLLATAYSSSLTGTSTIVGTGTNLTFKGIFESLFPKAEPVNFTQWMMFGVPQAVVQLIVTYFYILIFYMGLFRPNSRDAKEAAIGVEGERIANKLMVEKYKKLGPMSFHEIGVSILFVLCVTLWLTRRPGFMKGWAEYVSEIVIKDSAPVLFIVILMFVIPKEPRCFQICSKDANQRSIKSSEGLITWSIIENKMPWSLMFLLGGGFAIAKGSNESCLSARIGNSLTVLRHYPPYLILCIICFFISYVTEFTSNVGIANIALPVIAQMSVAIRLNPLYLMIPSTYMCSFSFRLPSGTPPNAIITVTGELPVKYLMIGGCIPSIYTYIVLILMFPTFGAYIFNLHDFPDWANPDINLRINRMCF